MSYDNDKKIVVIFPGINYSKDCPLLYYAGFKFQAQGYEKTSVSYNDLINTDKYKSFAECIDAVKETVQEQLKALELLKYKDIVFVSKSIGTAVAGWVDEKLGINARHVYLTPIEETMPYIKRGKNIITVVSGTNDNLLSIKILKEQCINENVPFKEINGVGHRLEVPGDLDKSIEVLKGVISLW